ncbi:hypothetical protein VPJ60_10175, partial [Limosilactobacillus fermentum]
MVTFVSHFIWIHIEGLAPYAVDAAIVLYTEPSLQGPVSINKTNLIRVRLKTLFQANQNRRQVNAF